MSERDFLTPREVADRVGVSYKRVLLAIRRGELGAFEIGGRFRIELAEYGRWSHAAPVLAARSDTGGRRRGGSRRGSAGFVAELVELEREVA